MADHRHGASRRDLEIDVEQDLAARIVAEIDVLEAHSDEAGLERAGTVGVGHLAMRMHQPEHALDVGQRLADLAIQDAEEIQRDVELKQERVDHDDVSETHLATRHAVRGLPHHQRHGDRDDQRLTGVEGRQRGLVADLGGDPLAQLLVVSLRLEVLVVEVLDGFEVDQAVDRPRVGRRIEFVGGAAQRRAPVGDGHREGDVEQQCAGGDAGEHRVVVHQQDADHQADLDQGRQDRIQGVADQRADRARAALDVPGQAPGLAFEVETQRQRMQVAKHLQRDPSHCLLGDAGEHQLAQLGEQRGRETERAVGQQQCRRHDDHRLRLGDVQRVDQLLEDDRYGDVGALGGEQAGQGDHHPVLVGPQVGEQLAKRLPVVAFGGLWARQCGGGSASHGRILSIRRRPAVNPRERRPASPASARRRSRHRRRASRAVSGATRVRAAPPAR